MSNRNVIQVFEHQVLKVNDSGQFRANHFNDLEKYGYSTREKYFSVGNKRIKFNNYVGVIQIRDLTIEVLPKADFDDANQLNKDKWHNALVHMLNECKLLKLDSITNSKLKLKSSSILDLYFESFISESEKILKSGLIKKYRTQEENIHALKGKLSFTKHIRKNLVHKERFYVENKVYDIDNAFNQVIKRGLIILKSITNNPKYISRINTLLISFENVSDVKIDHKSFTKLKYDRNKERYRAVVTLAKLIILRYNPDFKGGSENVIAIMFDMNLLFEQYIYIKIKVLQRDSEVGIKEVKVQNKVPFWENRGLKADIVIETYSNEVIVIDTKWKILKTDSPSDPDLKQMFVYNLHYNSKLSILLYPKTVLNSSLKKPFINHNFKDLFCQVAFVEIFNENQKLDSLLGYKIYNELIKDELLRA